MVLPVDWPADIGLYIGGRGITTNRPHPTGTFWSDQWGNLIAGPADPRCGTARTFGAKTYTTLCIEQYIAPSLTTVVFPGNSVQKDYDTTSVILPN